MAFLSGFKNTFFLWLIVLSSCGNGTGPSKKDSVLAKEVSSQDSLIAPIIEAANRTEVYTDLLRDKRLGIVANQTSVIFTKGKAKKPFVHLVDSLLGLQMKVIKVFAPEHGFRGEADAGEKVSDGTDTKTGLPIISLYGKNRKPSPEQLQGLDLVVFDIQDVGVRFYTYIATLQLVMEACAAEQIPLIVFDRPNPNASYVDGPSMKAENSSFLGMTEIPLVYGMTIGEYAKMINEEGWLADGLKADLRIIPLKNYSHSSSYSLKIRPSPNLPNDKSINLYPSLGLFEGTNVNAGRGTSDQFQRFGAPFIDSLKYNFSYIPQPNFGSKYPKQQGLRCYGKNLTSSPEMKEVSLSWLIEAYQNTRDKSQFFKTDSFTKHSGTSELQKQIEAGLSEAVIKASWREDLNRFRKIRKKYLMYPE